MLDGSAKVAEYIGACKDMGIPVLPPDINVSTAYFTVVPEGIRFGLAAVKNIGRGFIQKVVTERETGGPYQSLEDFCSRMYGTELNKRAVENLIKCGACDCFGLRRSQLLAIFEATMDSVADNRRRNVEGQIGMFDLGGDPEAISDPIPVPNLPELSRQERMAMEKEVTGLYLSGHPMDDYRAVLKTANVAAIGEILDCFEHGGSEFADEQIVTVAGIVQQMKMKTTRNNSLMAYVTLEDDTGAMELLVFSNAIDRYGSFLVENAAVVITGKISVRDEKAPQMIVNQAWSLENYSQAKSLNLDVKPMAVNKLYVQIPSENSRENRRVCPVLKMFPGKTPLILFYADTRTRRQTYCIPDPDLVKELREIVGEANVVLK